MRLPQFHIISPVLAATLVLTGACSPGEPLAAAEAGPRGGAGRETAATRTVAAPQTVETEDGPTFASDIAAIVHENCAPCHRPGEAGPFSLLTYPDVRRKASTVAAITASRTMPPWPADPSYSNFLGERHLSDEEIALIQQWVDNGAPEGDPARTPPLPDFVEGSIFGEPDLVVRMDEPLLLPGDNQERFMVVKLPYEIPGDTPVRAIEFVPDNRQLIHHMNGHIVQYDELKTDHLDGPYVVNRESVETLEETYGVINLLNDDGSYPFLLRSVSNYLPGGVSAVVYPEGIGGWILKDRGAFLMRDVHFGPTPIDVEDSSYFNVFFMDEPPQRPTIETQLGTLGVSEIIPPLIIPPNEVQTFTTSTVVQEDISLLTITPHMHLLGKSFEAYAEAPDGGRIPLIRIPEWDFRWQYFYTFPKIVKIPAGSRITAIGVFDNTTNNPNNPFSPPREIIGTNGSMRSTDEMFQLIMTFLPYEPGDENISLEADIGG
jgi:mono/diheme cytochrome c family protein